MKFTERDYKYLKGETFSNGYRMELENNPVYSRQETLLSILQGKTCIHVGCCDHIPLVEEKVRKNIWLHGELEKYCKNVIGIDIDQQAVDYINQKKYCSQSVYCADITESDIFEKFLLNEYEYILLGEIVEHVDNPVLFLKRMKENVQSFGFMGKFIITVPNAFCFLKNPIYQKGIEIINSDHRYWFTPFTIAKIMIQANIMPLELLFANYGKESNGKLEKSFQGDQIIILGI